MVSIATYVFMDLETTGLPAYENNKTKITEISMVAVKYAHILETKRGFLPRVQNKLTLCLNPRRMVSPESTEITGLCNDLLEYESTFNENIFSLIQTFLNNLTKPICLIAHNGLKFDFPIFKKQLEDLKSSLPEDIWCVDTYLAFYEILESRNSKEDVKNTSVEEDDIDSVSMQAKNESTPKQQMIPREKTTPMKNYDGSVIHKARKRLPWSKSSRPKGFYTLTSIYERLLDRHPVDAHRAENDCFLMLECVVVLGKEFGDWVNTKCMKFSDVKPMTVGVRVGQ